MEKQEIVYLPVKSLKPYKNNPRRISAEAVNAVCQAIKDVGFRRPIDVLPDGTMINGHTRLKAAKKLGLTEVPCIVCKDLDDAKIRKWRIEDNKTVEFSSWDADKLELELADLSFSEADFFDFDFESDLQRRKKLEESKKLCDLKDKIAVRKSNGAYYHSLFKTGKQGKPLEELKNKGNTYMFADTALEYIRAEIGDNLCDADWCILTTPRRRHAEGFHFATEICKIMADALDIPFYKDAFICMNKQRINAQFEQQKYPTEKNVLLYDDIITTGSTIKAARDLLIEAGYTVYTLISIDNH